MIGREKRKHFGGRCPSMLRRRCGAFTLIELLTVIAILGILLAMLLPTLHVAIDRGRIGRCQSTLNDIAAGLNHYTADNGGHMTGGGCDYRLLTHIHENWGWCYEYQAYYAMNNLISPYLGLGNCMPGTPHWSTAAYSIFKAFRCLAGNGLNSPYSPIAYGTNPWDIETADYDARSCVCLLYTSDAADE